MVIPGHKEPQMPSGIKLKKKQWINVNIVLGMPKRNCQYHGICKIELDDIVTRGCLPKIQADIRFIKNQLQIRFHKKKMTEAIINQHFASGYFIVLIDYALPRSLLRVLFYEPMVIRQGIYPVLEMEAYYTVFF